MTNPINTEARDNKKRFWRSLLTGFIFAFLLTFFGFFVLRRTELALRLALTPLQFGPLVWIAAFSLSADLRGRWRRVEFVCLMAAHYLGLVYDLWWEETYEWGLYLGALKYSFTQLLIYLWAQFFLWRRFVRDGAERRK
ncbi:MAG: hypothetical protein JW984_03235 [Deltaproteobacteria bacterium]|uniref:Uncharacterized protein n=1 Tax=Candidatus Zymogenus saltonus TaxID=2844893 RepID=A0A9D8PMT9_9DELT|nr:hypothetical protein [Candidatus Zymogenus saltonus]